MSYIQNFNYQILGDESKPKLVFLHGLMGFGNNWKTMARHFEAHFQILLYDQRGHGRSFQPAKGYSAQDMAEDLAQILDELGWKKATVVGHSMGGRVAVQFASLYPDRVEKLVIVDIGPVADMASMLSIEEKLRFVPVPFDSREEARAFFDGPFLEKYKNPVVKQFFYANLDLDSHKKMNWRFFMPGIQEVLWQSRVGDLWQKFRDLKGPALLVRGEKSVDLTAEVFDQVLKENPRIQGVTVPGAGHWVHVEKPNELLEIFRGFLL